MFFYYIGSLAVFVTILWFTFKRVCAILNIEIEDPKLTKVRAELHFQQDKLKLLIDDVDALEERNEVITKIKSLEEKIQTLTNKGKK